MRRSRAAARLSSKLRRTYAMRYAIRITLLLPGAVTLFAGHLDTAVRNDFLSGFAGDRDALARGMKKCEEVLAANPKDAEAMVWHGAGVFVASREAAQNKDYPKAMEL